MNISRIALTALSVAFAVGAAAQNSTPSAQGAASGSMAARGQFMSSDTDKDGRISKSEAQTAKGSLGSSFATLDADHDGYLSQTEFGKWDSSNYSPGPNDGKNREHMTPSTGGAQGTDRGASASGDRSSQPAQPGNPDAAAKSPYDSSQSSGNAR